MKKINLKKLLTWLKELVLGQYKRLLNKIEKTKKKIEKFKTSSPENAKKYKRYVIIISVVVGLFVLSIVRSTVQQVFAAIESKKERIIPVYAITVKAKDTTEKFKVNGNVMAENSANILPDIGGKVVRYVVRVGQSVKRGDIIGYVDPSKPGTSYNLSPVSAPIDGIISALPIEIGNTVTTTSIIAQMGDLSKLKVETYIPERFVEMVHLGKKALLTTTAFPSDSFEAEIYEMAPTLDPATRTRLVKLRVLDGKGKLLSGMFAELLIDSRLINQALSIPAEGIIMRAGTSSVFVISNDPGTHSSAMQVRKVERENKGAPNVKVLDPGYYDGRASLRTVVPGVQIGEYIVIKEGINVGDRVVFSGQGLLTDGMLAKIMPLQNPTQKDDEMNMSSPQENSSSDAEETPIANKGPEPFHLYYKLMHMPGVQRIPSTPQLTVEEQTQAQTADGETEEAAQEGVIEEAITEEVVEEEEATSPEATPADEVAPTTQEAQPTPLRNESNPEKTNETKPATTEEVTEEAATSESDKKKKANEKKKNEKSKKDKNQSNEKENESAQAPLDENEKQE